MAISRDQNCWRKSPGPCWVYPLRISNENYTAGVCGALVRGRCFHWGWVRLEEDHTQYDVMTMFNIQTIPPDPTIKRYRPVNDDNGIDIVNIFDYIGNHRLTLVTAGDRHDVTRTKTRLMSRSCVKYRQHKIHTAFAAVRLDRKWTKTYNPDISRRTLL